MINLTPKKFIGDLKLLIFNNTKITPCQQQLHGWRNEPSADSLSLKSLDLPAINELFMSPATEANDLSSQG